MTEITITIKLESDGENGELISWLSKALGGDNPAPAVKTKPRKARKPMTEAEKTALKERLAEGKRKAAIARGEDPDEIKPNQAKIAKAEAAGKAVEKARKKSKKGMVKKAAK